MGHDPEGRFFNPDEYQTAVKFGFNSTKKDSRPKKGCWAPGNYLNTCNECNEEFVGDKRACICADCSYKNKVTG